LDPRGSGKAKSANLQILVVGGLLMFSKRKFPKIKANRQIFTLIEQASGKQVEKYVESQYDKARFVVFNFGLDLFEHHCSFFLS
jgi:hypothetical protein